MTHPGGDTLSVRPYRPEDLDAAGRIERGSYYYLEEVRARGGLALLLCQGQQMVGYAAATPLPGLPHHYDLQLCIAQNRRRQGYGRFLWQQFVPYLRTAGVRIVSARVLKLEEPTARFLQQQSFFLEHSEWEMVRDNLADVHPVVWPAGFALQTYSAARAAHYFRDLYEKAFREDPSYQPYESDEEVVQELPQGRNMLFLTKEGRPVGVVWLRLAGRTGRIEPIGLAPEYQGRGLGRLLLQAALYALWQRGCHRAQLGVWTSNERAIHLYQQAGFRHVSGRYYLAYEISGERGADDADGGR